MNMSCATPGRPWHRGVWPPYEHKPMAVGDHLACRVCGAPLQALRIGVWLRWQTQLGDPFCLGTELTGGDAP
jgi:hypothetical protein